MCDSLCCVYTSLGQSLCRTAQTHSWHGQPCTFPLLHFYSPSTISFFELHHCNPFPRLMGQVQGVWRLSFHGSQAPLLPNSSLGGEGKDSKGKSLYVPISMQGQAVEAAVGVPGLWTSGRGLQQTRAEGPWLGSKQGPTQYTHPISYIWALQHHSHPTRKMGHENRESP